MADEKLKVAFRKAAELAPDPRNARRHSKAQIKQIRASMREFGFTIPVLIAGNSIVAGHGRTTAALDEYKAGGTLHLPNGAAIPAGMVPTLDVSAWSEEQRRAYLLADNQLALTAEWDQNILQSELSALAELDFSLEALGFKDEDLLRPGSHPAPQIKTIDVSEVNDRFWISVSGPLRHQAAMLEGLRACAAGLDDVSVELGTVER